MQEYRSGHNEAVLKTVWVKAHGGSNPSSCAKKGTSNEVPFLAQEESKESPKCRGFARGARKAEF